MNRKNWINFKTTGQNLEIQSLYDFYLKNKKEDREVLDFPIFVNLFQQYLQFGNINKYVEFMDNLYQITTITKDGTIIGYT